MLRLFLRDADHAGQRRGLVHPVELRELVDVVGVLESIGEAEVRVGEDLEDVDLARNLDDFDREGGLPLARVFRREIRREERSEDGDGFLAEGAESILGRNAQEAGEKGYVRTSVVFGWLKLLQMAARLLD